MALHSSSFLTDQARLLVLGHRAHRRGSSCLPGEQGGARELGSKRLKLVSKPRRQSWASIFRAFLQPADRPRQPSWFSELASSETLCPPSSQLMMDHCSTLDLTPRPWSQEAAFYFLLPAHPGQGSLMSFHFLFSLLFCPDCPNFPSLSPPPPSPLSSSSLSLPPSVSLCLPPSRNGERVSKSMPTTLPSDFLM